MIVEGGTSNPIQQTNEFIKMKLNNVNRYG
jgi:hypothetical protein